MNITFLTIVQMFQMQALIGMGKLMNPMTGAIERNLDHAKSCIDMLGVLEVKTRNNLNDEEQRSLKYILQDLRLNYVAEADKDNAPALQEHDSVDDASKDGE